VDTWIFLGVLAAASVLVVRAYGWAISQWEPPAERADIVSTEHFVRMRGQQDEVDLGRGWRGTDDPGAAWHLWWIASTGEIMGMRTSYLPPPPGPTYMGSWNGRSPLDPMGFHHFTGMRVLARTEQGPSRAWCEAIRELPDGLDLFTGGTHGAPPPVTS
jgi:hypothetical protein